MAVWTIRGTKKLKTGLKTSAELPKTVPHYSYIRSSAPFEERNDKKASNRCPEIWSRTNNLSTVLTELNVGFQDSMKIHSGNPTKYHFDSSSYC